VPHPFDPDPAARLYRTGDRARYRADGAIEFLGRVDRQVKIRGHRIELAEIEAALARLPYVREAVVLVRGATGDTRRIVAWVVPTDADGPPPATLRKDLRRILPDYMLPAATVWLPALPLNANGKVDPFALPEPGDTARPAAGVAVPPRDMFEGVLVRIWEDLLGITGIGVFDRFFEIGGHSLLAARLVDTIERETGLSVPLTVLFADDTIDGLAKALRDGAPDANAPIVVVNAQGTRPPFVFLHGDFQAGGFYSRALARSLGADQPTLIVHPHGLVGDAIPETIEAMATDRLRALQAIRPTGPYVIGGHCNGALVAFEMARQLISRGESVPAVVLIEARAPAPGARSPDAGGAYVKFDAAGRPEVLVPRDRISEAELHYARAIDRYEGGHCDGHLVIVQAQELRDPAPDAGWSRFARTWEGHIVPGGHVTLITRHLADLTRTVRDAIGRALDDPARDAEAS
jgi:thioesterase domain-containing protein